MPGKKVYGERLVEKQTDAQQKDAKGVMQSASYTLKDLHRPYIDDIRLPCKCGKEMSRIHDVLDVWFDSGLASWASLGYPNRKELFENMWPADLNIEGPDQIRGWWNSQLITGVITFNKAPFKNILFHGFTLDAHGSKMSKSKDNYIGLLEGREQVWKKLAPAVTDPARKRRTDPGNPDICNIYSYHRLVDTPEELGKIEGGCRSAGIGCLDCKRAFLENLMKVLDPIQQRHQELSERPGVVRERLDASAQKCRGIARDTILETKRRLGLRDVWKI